MAALPDYAKFLAEGYGEDLNWQVRRSEMDRGVAKQRPGISKPLRVRKGTLLIHTKANKMAFEQWLDTIGGGTGWFDYTDPQKVIDPDYFEYSEPPANHALVRARFINTVWNFELRNNTVWVASCEMESIG